MTERGFQPDAVTLLALLSVCRHRGLVEMGEQYFFSMTKDYNISPGTDHYASMIDLYGRANQLEKAVSLMEKLPIEPDAVILGAFLNACKMNRNAELAKAAEDKLLQIEGGNGSRYTQLAGIYASEGKRNEMGRVMKMMRGREAKKTAGRSWVYVGDTVHTFISGDRSHSDNDAIYITLGCLIRALTKLSATLFFEEELCTFR